MWKRIQTLYLGIAAVLSILIFFSTFAIIAGSGGEQLTIGFHEKKGYLSLMIMLFIAQIAAVATYKTFFLQARVAGIAALISLGLQIWIGIDVIRFHDSMSFTIAAVYPLAITALDLMAAKRSMVDEMTVQAVRGVRKSRKGRK